LSKLRTFQQNSEIIRQGLVAKLELSFTIRNK
jgi:hypothetical protein